jgi:hypothetical protein
MFSALSTVIIQGLLPEEASAFLLITYSLSSSLSFAFLFLSIVICIEVTMRASKFMYDRSRRQTENLQESIKNANIVLQNIRDMNGIVSMSEAQVDSEWLKHEDDVQKFLRARDKIIGRAADQVRSILNSG